MATHIDTPRLAPKTMLESVTSAVAALEDNDRDLLRMRGTERALSHRLAVYLEHYLGNRWTVDCEYNKHGPNPKRVTRGSQRRLVRPDIVAHKRGNDSANALVVELKLNASASERRQDREKLIAYKRELNYQYAIFAHVRSKEGTVTWEAIW